MPMLMLILILPLRASTAPRAARRCGSSSMRASPVISLFEHAYLFQPSNHQLITMSKHLYVFKLLDNSVLDAGVQHGHHEGGGQRRPAWESFLFVCLLADFRLS